MYSESMEEQKEKILVVDDDLGIREMLQEYLSGNGYDVSSVADGIEMEQYLVDHVADLVILDLMLPGEDGLTLARKLKSRSKQPIIILSARGDDIDRIVGLEVGADDYLAKPFNPRELLARVRAVLRRQDNFTPIAVTSQHDQYQFNGFKLNFTSHCLTKDGQDVQLTSGEFNLLRIFAEHPNRVLNRDFILELLKGYERMPFDRSIDVRVTRLRRKIENDPSTPLFIRTVWGEGYLFSPQGKAQ
jgi:two-component system phosphate regulon response regulator OmpR